jgi:pyruvate,orthophosphate dikinase
MTNIGLPFPRVSPSPPRPAPAITRTARESRRRLSRKIFEYLAKLEEICGKKFGDKENPLLSPSARGPGVDARDDGHDPDLGLTMRSRNASPRKAANPRWAYDCYRRFIQMFSDVVMELPKSSFEKIYRGAEA